MLSGEKLRTEALTLVRAQPGYWTIGALLVNALFDAHREGKLYLCAIKDVFSGRIVGYSMNSRMKSQLAVDALASAVARRGSKVAGCVVHSDRGSQLRSRRFLDQLRQHDLVGSMGQVASAWDNAAMENFFALLQNNVLDRRR